MRESTGYRVIPAAAADGLFSSARYTYRRRRVGTRIPPSSSKGHGPEGCSRLPATITDDGGGGGQMSLEAVVAAEDAIPGRGPRIGCTRNARYIIYKHVCGQRKRPK